MPAVARRAPTALCEPTQSTGAVGAAAAPLGVSQGSMALCARGHCRNLWLSIVSASWACWHGSEDRPEKGCCFHILSTIPLPIKWLSASLQNT